MLPPKRLQVIPLRFLIENVGSQDQVEPLAEPIASPIQYDVRLTDARKWESQGLKLDDLVDRLVSELADSPAQKILEAGFIRRLITLASPRHDRHSCDDHRPPPRAPLRFGAEGLVVG